MQSNVATVSKGKLQKNPVNINKSITFTALALIVFGFFLIGFIVSYKQALLYLIAGVLGLTLYHAHYGFTSSFRQFLTTGQGVGIRAQMILFLFSNVLFLPILLGAIGSGAVGYVSPVGISVIIGAFIFGIGMQLGDGCASGTLYHLGAGDARAILSLIGFVIGSVIGSAHFTWWIQTPNIGAI